jgi:RimJ/RimL family protein N-acetyltransferase
VPRLHDSLPAGDFALRRWDPSYVDALMDALEASRSELTRWMPWATPWPSLELERAVLANGRDLFDADRQYDFAIFEGDELVGGAGLMPVEDDDAWQIGYWVRTDRTRRGIATVAAAALTTAAFDLLGLDAVQLRMDQANVASAAVPPKLGYALIASPERVVLAPGHTGNGFIWTMTRARWRRSEV